MALCACAGIGLLVTVLVAVHVAGEPRFHNASADAVSVRTVALDVERAHQEESTIAAEQEMESTGTPDDEEVEEADTWGETGSDDPGDVYIRVGKMVVVQRRGLRTSKPYPCGLLAGACGGSQPGSTVVCCGRVCADVLTNRNHCGRCGHVCRASRGCCNGKCRRLATDERNCGRCGAWCAPGTRCLFGFCGY